MRKPTLGRTGGLVALAASAVVVTTAGVVLASDHQDTSEVELHPRLDINDVYAFPGGNPDRVVLAVTTSSPLGGPELGSPAMGRSLEGMEVRTGRSSMVVPWSTRSLRRPHHIAGGEYGRCHWKSGRRWSGAGRPRGPGAGPGRVYGREPLFPFGARGGVRASKGRPGCRRTLCDIG